MGSQDTNDRSLIARFNRFITPDRSSPWWVRLAPYGILILAGLIMFVLAGAGWEYTNSSEFCGTACHTMPPEYAAYQRSPHAEVKCVECHIGRAYIATQFARKAQDITHVVRLIGADYEVPIYATKMRPASQICERCHNPLKVSETTLHEDKRYDAARNNELNVTYLALKTGGGTYREGQGRGIHWHIENQVEYIATDEPWLDQEIPWVRVTYADSGETDVFVDIEADLPANFVDQNRDRLKKVDCITCHNRISHMFRSPSDAIDSAMARGVISPDIPYFKQNAVAVMERQYPSMDEALKAINGLVDYYQTTWPEFYADNIWLVYNSVQEVARLYQEMVSPTMDVSWNTHPSNDSHRNSPGCFRCHDGKHLDENQKSITASCDTCHSVPTESRPDGTTPTMPVVEPFQPESHSDSNWMARHRFAFDDTCDGCHTVANPGGSDNSSFCANSGCHGETWRYSGLDSPKLLELFNVLDETLPTFPEADLTWSDLVGPILAERCVVCHGDAGGLNLETYKGAMAGGQSGPAVIPGSGSDSLLVSVQRDGHPNRLPDRQLLWLEKWIDEGAPQ